MSFDWRGLLSSIFSGPPAAPGSVGASVSVPLTTTFAPAIPQRPAAIPYPSPNFKSAPGRQVTCVIIHATAGGLAGSLAEMCDPKPAAPDKRVSAHYCIDRDGTVYKLVHEDDIAWHAGQSFWQGRSGVNAFSIGIELVNMNDGIDPYPEPQLAAAAQLTRAICAERGIPASEVVGHQDIAPGRKHDPGPQFPWAAFRARLA